MEITTKHKQDMQVVDIARFQVYMDNLHNTKEIRRVDVAKGGMRV